MKKEGFRIFWITFLSLSLGMAVGLFVYQALGAWIAEDNVDSDWFLKLMGKSLIVGIGTAFILAVLNGFFKIFPMQPRKM